MPSNFSDVQITDADRAARNLIRPDLEVREHRTAKDRGKRPVDGVLPAGDFDTADARHVEARVGREPMAAKVDLRVGMEIHVVLRIGKPDIGQMAGHIAGREIEGAVERDREMSEVAAHAVAALEDIPRGEIRAARHVAILDIIVHPLADGVHARQAVAERGVHVEVRVDEGRAEQPAFGVFARQELRHAHLLAKKQQPLQCQPIL